MTTPEIRDTVAREVPDVGRLREAATKAPWELRGPTGVYGNLQRDQNCTGDLVARTVRPEDAALIVTIPALLDEVERLRTENERLQERAAWPAMYQRWCEDQRAIATLRKALEPFGKAVGVEVNEDGEHWSLLFDRRGPQPTLAQVNLARTLSGDPS